METVKSDFLLGCALLWTFTDVELLDISSSSLLVQPIQSERETRINTAKMKYNPRVSSSRRKNRKVRNCKCKCNSVLHNLEILSQKQRVLDGHTVVSAGEENKPSGLVLWESFNHPLDSFLPGMKIGLNNRTWEHINLTSWKSDSDPYPGSFMVLVDPQELAQIFIVNDFVKYIRTGQWNGKRFIVVPNMISDYRYGFNLMADNQ
ncbi:G-type lectin S-receptor-like serine/threonine-protein kinase [Abeliophyllum distichum]|uniref:G-type lectin S-receptor-like serine/threonine-protein kinase n=1 Tax=Abeliophyllum distichum TaxID=126358 RepID=A0ABD1SFT1_9LAMI